MDWCTNRRGLEVLKSPPAKNTSFKRKLGIINRIKNISPETYSQLLEDIKNENLQRFYTEIVNSLISGAKAQTNEDVWRLVQIVYLYSYDPAFVAQLSAGLKKAIPESWVCGALYAELQFLTYGSLGEEIKRTVDAYKEVPLLLINYLVHSFNYEEIKCIEECIKKATENKSSKNTAVANAIRSRLGWPIEPVVSGNFVEVVKLLPGEFCFYSTASTAPSEQVHACDLKRLETEPGNGSFLDALGKYIKNNKELIGRLLRKRKNQALIPAIARVISNFGEHRNSIAALLLKGDPLLLPKNDLLLIGELYKFDVIKQAEIISLLASFMRLRNISGACILFGCVGRYMLGMRETNKFARSALEWLRTVDASDEDRVFISSCLGSVFSPGLLKTGIRSFFRWFFTEKNFSSTGLFKCISSSRRLLFCFFSQPELFESDALLVRIIAEVNMTEEMKCFYFHAISVLFGRERHMACRIAEVLGEMAREKSHSGQEAFMDAVLGLEATVEARVTILLIFLERINPDFYEKYMCWLFQNTPARMRPMLFNFCEKYKYDYYNNWDDEACADSFEEEMESLR